MDSGTSCGLELKEKTQPLLLLKQEHFFESRMLPTTTWPCLSKATENIQVSDVGRGGGEVITFTFDLEHCSMKSMAALHTPLPCLGLPAFLFPSDNCVVSDHLLC